MLHRVKKFTIAIVRIPHTLLNVLRSIQLMSYDTSIQKIINANNRDSSNKYAIFVYYEPNGGVSKSAINILNALQLASVNSIVVCNHELSEEQVSHLKKYAHKIIVRKNQGADFGGYKDAVDYLIREGVKVERLGFLNDSVYYFSKGVDKFVEDLFDREGVSTAFENWQVPHKYHLQSFAICVNSKIFKSSSFSNFWKNYRPVSSRVYAIEKGEKALTESILKSSPEINVIYSIQKVIDNFENFEISRFDLNASFPTALKGIVNHSFMHDTKDNKEISKMNIINAISAYSPIHTGARFFIHLGCPFLKKDMVYRMGFSAWEVENICLNAFDDSEVNEFMSIIRKKGNAYSLPIFKRALFAIGII